MDPAPTSISPEIEIRSRSGLLLLGTVRVWVHCSETKQKKFPRRITSLMDNAVGARGRGLSEVRKRNLYESVGPNCGVDPPSYDWPSLVVNYARLLYSVMSTKILKWQTQSVYRYVEILENCMSCVMLPNFISHKSLR